MAFEHGQIVNGDGRLLFAAATAPRGFVARLRGLLFRCPPEPQQAWWFSRCACVHTLGMRFAIDVVHLDAAGQVLKIREALPAWRVSFVWGGRVAVELGAGVAARVGLRERQVLRFVV